MPITNERNHDMQDECFTHLNHTDWEQPGGILPHARSRPSIVNTREEQLPWTENKERILMGPYNYLANHPGKDVRGQFIAAFNVWLQVPSKSLDVITKVTKLLHTASLLIDDIEDFSVLRRGIPVANSVFGVAQTINSANYVYFQALSELKTLDNPELVDIFTSELLNLHRGQGLDLFWRDTLTCPSEAEYLDMVNHKTGGLFRLAVRLMQAESTTSIHCSALVTAIGQLFQILDDYLNLSPTAEYDAMKGYCEDLTEGKFSFPAIHAIHADSNSQVLLGILRLRTTNKDIKKCALDYIESKGSLQYCRDKIQELRLNIERLIDDIDVQMGHSDRG
ncbi:terpenoid synthase [Byssothecium circinans]|uniref:geranylgeranyl diphosphate synthase n=1 Tax=Byssothecium circinans TaxID=147558 RepID=A0A6A5UC08_9PLEO|nr:terpenoid synthase [Byssothecium circinans]